MGNTLGYITGALSGLALLSCLGYTLENKGQALDAVHDTQSSITRTLEKPKGYIGEGNLLEVLADATHDLGQRNPSRAWKQLDRIDVGLENTPYQDQKLDASHYKHATEFSDYLKHELGESWALSDYVPSGWKSKGELTAGLGALALGIATAAALAKKKP